MKEPATFDDDFRLRLHELFVWRRDVRRFQRDPLPAGVATGIEMLAGAPIVRPGGPAVGPVPRPPCP